MYHLDIKPEIRKSLTHLPPERKQKIRDALRFISLKPYLGKSLQEKLDGFFTFRVGRLRIVYSIDDAEKVVSILAIGPRSSIYEELERAVSPPKPGS